MLAKSRGKVALLVLVLVLVPKLARCEKRGITLGFTVGCCSKSGFTLGFVLDEHLSIEGHWAKLLPFTEVALPTWGVSAKYWHGGDNPLFILVGWSRIMLRFPRRFTDNQGRQVSREGLSSGLNIGSGREWLIEGKAIPPANKILGVVEGGMFIALKSEAKSITFEDKTQTISRKGTFIRYSPFLVGGMGLGYYPQYEPE